MKKLLLILLLSLCFVGSANADLQAKNWLAIISQQGGIEAAELAAEQGDIDAQYHLSLYYSGTFNQLLPIMNDATIIEPPDQKKAFYWIKKAAEQKQTQVEINTNWSIYSSAKRVLGSHYENGLGVTKDLEKAFYWYTLAYEQGHIDAKYDLIRLEQRAIEKIAATELAAEQGNIKAQYHLGLMYYEGKGVTKDLEKAFHWFKKAAEQGDIKAQYHLGSCYELGLGVTKDLEKAFHWFKKAAEQGHARAQLIIGSWYIHGNGVTKNDNQALYWIEKAAEQGDVDAQAQLALIYYYGKVVPHDIKKMFYWLTKAAEQGDASSQMRLGFMLITLDRMSKAAEQGDASAQNGLDLLYTNGEDYSQPLKKAAYWIKLAIENGNEEALNIWNKAELWKYE
jgi:uncharacterized protein